MTRHEPEALFLPGDRRRATFLMLRYLGFPLLVVIALTPVAWLLNGQGWKLRVMIGLAFTTLLVAWPTIKVWQRCRTAPRVQSFLGDGPLRAGEGIWESRDRTRRVRRWRLRSDSTAHVSFEATGPDGWVELERIPVPAGGTYPLEICVLEVPMAPTSSSG